MTYPCHSLPTCLVLRIYELVVCWPDRHKSQMIAVVRVMISRVSSLMDGYKNSYTSWKPASKAAIDMSYTSGSSRVRDSRHIMIDLAHIIGRIVLSREYRVEIRIEVRVDSDQIRRREPLPRSKPRSLSGRAVVHTLMLTCT